MGFSFSYKGIRTAQQQPSFPEIFSIMKDYEVTMFVELGTYAGGLSMAVRDAFPRNKDGIHVKHMKIHTFDKDDHRHDLVKKSEKHIIFHQESVLEKCQTVIDLINKPERVLLFCDNGKKTEEVNLYAKYLKRGDLIGIHDWGTEVFWEDVSASLNYMVYEPIRRDIFRKNEWLVRFFQRR